MQRIRDVLIVLLAISSHSLLFAEDTASTFGPTIRQDAKSRQKGWITLVYGGEQSPAGMRLREMFDSTAFRNATSVRYLLGFVNQSATPPTDVREAHARIRANAYGRGGSLDTLRTPAIFAGDKEGELFLVWENVSADLPFQTILERIKGAHARQTELKSRLLGRVFSHTGQESAEKCGEFLAEMIPFLGDEARVRDEKAYLRVWNRLRKLDPKDKTGWVRRFTLGDGAQFVKQAAVFALQDNASEGLGFLAAERAKPSEHLSIQQRQALDMAAFTLYRKDESKREEALALLRKVCAEGYATPWGVAAMGWLASYGNPPLSVPYGWHPGDLQRGTFKMKVKIGVREAFPEAGRYEVSFAHVGFGGVRFDTLELFEGGESLLLAKNPVVSADGLTTTFTFDLHPEYGDMVTSFAVTGFSDAGGGASSGSIHVSRVGLRTRKSIVPEPAL
ncbi:MAG TPA: hypothetical protein DER26_02305 [Verrucomicrobia bacterium]|nr:hypothetical protein [Verrucomicrobiota bacterium]